MAGGSVLSSLFGGGGSGPSKDQIRMEQGSQALQAGRLAQTSDLRQRLIAMLTGGLSNPNESFQPTAGYDPAQHGAIENGQDNMMDSMAQAGQDFEPQDDGYKALLNKYMSRLGYGGVMGPKEETPWSGTVPRGDPRRAASRPTGNPFGIAQPQQKWTPQGGGR